MGTIPDGGGPAPDADHVPDSGSSKTGMDAASTTEPPRASTSGTTDKAGSPPDHLPAPSAERTCVISASSSKSATDKDGTGPAAGQHCGLRSGVGPEADTAPLSVVTAGDADSSKSVVGEDGTAPDLDQRGTNADGTGAVSYLSIRDRGGSVPLGDRAVDAPPNSKNKPKKPGSKKRLHEMVRFLSSDEEVDTVKDSFWRNLEEGVLPEDLCDTDLYSGVRCSDGESGNDNGR